MSNENPITINAIGVREGILQFAVAMEEEMRKKDKIYNDSHRNNNEFLIEHLIEERDEVDSDIYSINLPNAYLDYVNEVKINVRIELVHEAIMCMLISDYYGEKR